MIFFSTANEWAEIALPCGRETKVHTVKKCITLGRNISSVSEKLSSGTQPPRSVAPSETPTAALSGSQSTGSGHSAPVCTGGGSQVHIVPEAPQLAAHTSVRVPREDSKARPV